MSLRHHTSGNAKSWQHRPSDHTRCCGYRKHIYGPIIGLDSNRGFLARLFNWSSTK